MDSLQMTIFESNLRFYRMVVIMEMHRPKQPLVGFYLINRLTSTTKQVRAQGSLQLGAPRSAIRANNPRISRLESIDPVTPTATCEVHVQQSGSVPTFILDTRASPALVTQRSNSPHD
ncbi:hypothetical protein FRC12_019391 [Ceratobasidium sp. 428]|nr:hypothetical protein FRC12_019391 [Ceratobasidium sp. 428]